MTSEFADCDRMEKTERVRRVFYRAFLNVKFFSQVVFTSLAARRCPRDLSYTVIGRCAEQYCLTSSNAVRHGIGTSTSTSTVSRHFISFWTLYGTAACPLNSLLAVGRVEDPVNISLSGIRLPIISAHLLFLFCVINKRFTAVNLVANKASHCGQICSMFLSTREREKKIV